MISSFSVLFGIIINVIAFMPHKFQLLPPIKGIKTSCRLSWELSFQSFAIWVSTIYNFLENCEEKCGAGFEVKFKGWKLSNYE